VQFKNVPEQAGPEFDLKGNTLRTYLFLLKSGDKPLSLRRVQRSLGFSSPSLAQYHLEKLVDMQLVRKDNDGAYSLMKEVKVEMLMPFFRLGSLILPRLLMYAAMFSVLLLYFFLEIYPSSNIFELQLWGAIFGVASVVIFWYEAVRSWKHVPG
jgi:hypothetical protein